MNCGRGERVREVYCREEGSSKNQSVEDQFCSHHEKPLKATPCFRKECDRIVDTSQSGDDKEDASPTGSKYDHREALRTNQIPGGQDKDRDYHARNWINSRNKGGLSSR